MTNTQSIKSTLTTAMPLIAAFLAQKGMQFIDTLMMGWLGPAALAAGALGTAIFIVMLVFCMGTLSSVGVLTAYAKGENNTAEIKSSLLNGIWLALLLSIPCIFVLWIAPPIFIRGVSQEVLDNTVLLLHGLSIGLPGYLLFLILREFVSVFALTRIVMLVTVCSIPLTFAMNYIFIYGKLGLPAFGVAGIGYASAMVMWLMFLSLLLYSVKQQKLKEYFAFATYQLNWHKIKDMLSIGMPSGTFFLLESAMFFASVIMMEYFGTDALASYQIAFQSAGIAYAIPFALSMASALQMGRALGAKEYSLVKMIVMQNFSLGILFSLLIALCFVFFPEFIVGLFLDKSVDQENIIRIASSFVMLTALFLCLDAIQAIANGMLRGLRDTFIPMLLNVGCYWVIAAPSGYFLAFHTSLGVKGIWYGITLGICSLGVLLIIRLRQKLSVFHLSPTCWGEVDARSTAGEGK